MNLNIINPYYESSEKNRSASANTYPYAWIEAVTDRTQKDVDRVEELLNKSWQNFTNEEKREYMEGLKGALNRIDLERIENNIQILLDVLEIESESCVGAVPEFPTVSYFTKMQKNVEAIRQGYMVHADTPKTPELPFNTWKKINDIEKILYDVYKCITSQFQYYVNEVYVGDIVGYVL